MTGMAEAGGSGADALETLTPEGLERRPDEVRHHRPRRIAGLASHELLVAVVLAVATFALRLLYAATGPTDWDSSQFLAGTSHFDVVHDSPHPPGYFLYVEVGRAVHAVTGLDRVDSLVLLSAVASALASGVLYLAARALLKRWLALAAVVLVGTAPVTWYAGSIVDTYSFDELAASVLLLLACRARRGGHHGTWALCAFGILAGFRQSLIETLPLLALVAVVASVRSVRQLVEAVLAGLAGLAIWVVPLAVTQPGGLWAWYRASHAETVGAYHTGSILVANAGAGRTNLGVLAAYTVMLLGLPLLLWAIGMVGLLASGASPREWWPKVAGRTWCQRPLALLVAGLLPAVTVYLVVLFGKGGYALAYVPTATVVLLYPLSVVPPRVPVTRVLTQGLAGVLVLAGAAFNAQRFTAGQGILPLSATAHLPGLWLTQARYGAPYPETAATIRSADRYDRSLRRLSAIVRPGDVVLVGADDPKSSSYRAVSWALPANRIYLVSAAGLVYGEQHGQLDPLEGTVVPVDRRQRLLVLASSTTPSLAAVAQVTGASAVPGVAGGHQLWQLPVGSSYLGARTTAVAHVPPLP